MTDTNFDDSMIELDLLGGEPLDGSGFENESSDSDAPAEIKEKDA